MKFKAFTLAEILVTIGIIGFVSAMTIPSLISNAKDTRFRTQFLKTYTVIQQALRQSQLKASCIRQPRQPIGQQWQLKEQQSLQQSMV